jgi:phage-related protein
MASKLVSFPLLFWKSSTGREPVREFLQEQTKPDRMRLGSDLRKLQFGWPIGMPLVRSFGDGLWELRSSMPSRREVRIMFAAEDDMLVLLHAFVKKTQKTPPSEIAVARQRLKELQL